MKFLSHTLKPPNTFYLQGGKKQVMELPITKSDVGTQTDTHFYQSNIIGSYEWNEWELRRKALKLVH